MDAMPSAREWNELSIASGEAIDLDEARQRWNENAPSFINKPRRSGYIRTLLGMLDLNPDESVLDMGCGPGLLSIPLAQAGHDVVAVDISDVMLNALRKRIDEAKVNDQVTPFQRAWQDSWDDLPVVDVCISSRSLSTRDFADAVTKLEAHARSRVIVTLAAGETGGCDLRLQRALGRDTDEVRLSQGFVMFLNYLLMLGRTPKVDYVVDTRNPQSDDATELREFLMSTIEPMTPEEEEQAMRFLDEHIEPHPESGFQLDYPQTTRWAVITWDVPARD